MPAGQLLPGFKVGVPSDDSLEFFGDDDQRAAYQKALSRLEELGCLIVPVDFTPFYQTANLLYQGAWVAERYSVIESLLKMQPTAILEVTRAIIQKAESLGAVDAFRDQYALKKLRRQVEQLIAPLDVLCVPSIPRFYTIEDLQNDPVEPNTRLVTYTNFVNLLDMCGITVPTDARADGLPGSVTLLAAAGEDKTVSELAESLQQICQPAMGATGWRLPEPLMGANSSALSNEIALAVVGAHRRPASQPRVNRSWRQVFESRSDTA